jgi:hypothetical protein
MENYFSEVNVGLCREGNGDGTKARGGRAVSISS